MHITRRWLWWDNLEEKETLLDQVSQGLQDHFSSCKVSRRKKKNWSTCSYQKNGVNASGLRNQKVLKHIKNCLSTFWMNIAMYVELSKPLVRVLRLVEGDWCPLMVFVYRDIKEAKYEIIRIWKDVKGTYEPILKIIDSKIKGRLDSPLHLSAYLLNS